MKRAIIIGASSGMGREVKHRRHVKVIDWRYSILTFFWCLIPNPLWRRLPLVTKEK